MSDENRPWDNDPNAGSFGAWLRRQREVREITLREIAEESKISFRYLEALEQDRFEILPAPVFAKGFLREYARFVGLDPDEVVNYYISALPDEEPEEETERRMIIPPERSSSMWPLVGVLTVLIAALLAFYWFSSRDKQSDSIPDIVAPTTESTASVVEMVEPAVQEPIRMTLDFSQKSWVVVLVDGEQQVSELRVQGESLKLSAEREIRVTLGNVAGVSLEVNEIPMPIEVGDDEELVVNLESVSSLASGDPDSNASVVESPASSASVSVLVSDLSSPERASDGSTQSS